LFLIAGQRDVCCRPDGVFKRELMPRAPLIQYQRAETRAAAITVWINVTTRARANRRPTTVPSSPDGIASTGVRIKGQAYFHRIPHEIHSTLTRLVTGRAFAGAYRLKFNHKNLPLASEDITCACRAVPEDTFSFTAHSHTTGAYATCPWTGRWTRYGNSLTARSVVWACYESKLPLNSEYPKLAEESTHRILTSSASEGLSKKKINCWSDVNLGRQEIIVLG
jgi:hypothetical protein